jgi:hypothetical protein
MGLANYDKPPHFRMNSFSEPVLDCVESDCGLASSGRLGPKCLEDSSHHEEFGWADEEGRVKFLGVAALRTQEALACSDALR